MLKITTIAEHAEGVRLRLEGKITAQWTTLLDGICRAHLARQQAVELDCAHVDFIDARGVDVLNELTRGDVVLQRAPSFITQMLKSGGQP